MKEANDIDFEQTRKHRKLIGKANINQLLRDNEREKQKLYYNTNDSTSDL